MIKNMFRNTRRLAGPKTDSEPLCGFQNRNLCTELMEFDLSESILAW